MPKLNTRHKSLKMVRSDEFYANNYTIEGFDCGSNIFWFAIWSGYSWWCSSASPQCPKGWRNAFMSLLPVLHWVGVFYYCFWLSNVNRKYFAPAFVGSHLSMCLYTYIHIFVYKYVIAKKKFKHEHLNYIKINQASSNFFVINFCT